MDLGERESKKRIGIVLLSLIFMASVAWSARTQHVNDAPAAHGAPVTRDVASSASLLQRVREQVRTTPTDASRHVLLRSEQAVYAFDPQGARLVHVSMRHHRNHRGEQVALLEPGSGMTWCFRKKGSEGLVPMDRLPFQVKQEDSSVTFIYKKGTAEAITCRYALADGLLRQHIALGKAWRRDVAQFCCYHTPKNQEKHLGLAQERTYLYYKTKGSYAYQRGKKELAVQSLQPLDGGEPLWISTQVPYFLSAMVLEEGLQQATVGIKASDKGDHLAEMGVEATLSAQEAEDRSFQLAYYFGENAPEALAKVDASYAGLHLGRNYYHGPGFLGRINQHGFAPVLGWLYGCTGHALLALFLLLLLLLLLFAFFNRKRYVLDIQKKAATPFLQAVKREQAKGDRGDLQMVERQFYQELGINPVRAALPSAVLSLFSFIALLNLCKYSILFRQRSFLWMDDISSYDDFISLPLWVPLLGDHLSLPALAAAAIPLVALLVKRFRTGQDGASAAQQVTGEQAMPRMMPYFFFFFTLYFFNGRMTTIALLRLGHSLLQKLEEFVYSFTVRRKELEAAVAKKARRITIKTTSSRSQARLERKLLERK